LLILILLLLLLLNQRKTPGGSKITKLVSKICLVVHRKLAGGHK